jgi:hypothetical protein
MVSKVNIIDNPCLDHGQGVIRYDWGPGIGNSKGFFFTFISVSSRSESKKSEKNHWYMFIGHHGGTQKGGRHDPGLEDLYHLDPRLEMLAERGLFYSNSPR